MKKAIVVLSILLLVAMSAYTQVITTTRPTESVMICDFENGEELLKWEGLEHRRSTSHFSSGSYGMSFDIPKWIEARGDEPRPDVSLSFNDGAGYPFKDWSQYHAVLIDVWVEGDAPGKLGIKLRDTEKNNSWTTHIDVEPGKCNTAELLIRDAAGDADVTDVQEVVLYSLRPQSAFTITVDNLRLVSGPKPALSNFYLTYPNYRELIFPQTECVEIEAQIEAGEHGYKPRQLAVALSLSDGENVVRKQVRLKKNSRRFRIAHTALKPGNLTLTASLIERKSEKVLDSQEWALTKITTAERDALHVYIDQHQNTILDGEPFFPLGFYVARTMEQINEIEDSPYNTLLFYGTTRVPEKEMRAVMDTLQEKDLKLIFCLNDLYPSATYFKGKDWQGITGNEAIADAVVKAYKDHPSMLAWYLNDEIPAELAPELNDYYQRVRKEDPNHPAFIVLCQKKDLASLQHTTDILSGDPYPIPREPVSKVSDMMIKCNEAVHDARPVWCVPQSFAWYQHSGKADNRGRIPTEEDLRTGRAPTYEEARCMTYLALAHGAKGLVYWCYYNMRVLPQYEEMWGWMKDIGQEVKTLSPMLLSPEDLGEVPYSPQEAGIHTKLKRYNGRLYLMAVNADSEAHDVTFSFKHRIAPCVTVLFEEEEPVINTDGKRLRDHFAPLEVHVYDLGPSAPPKSHKAFAKSVLAHLFAGILPLF